MSKEEKITLKASLEVESLKGAEKIRNAFESDQAFRHKELQMNQLSSQLSRAGFGGLSGVLDDKDAKKIKQLQAKEIEENKKKFEDLNKVLKKLVGGIETYEKAIAKAKEEGKGGRQVVLEEQQERLEKKIILLNEELKQKAEELKDKTKEYSEEKKGGKGSFANLIEGLSQGSVLGMMSMLGIPLIATKIAGLAIQTTKDILATPREIISSTGAAKESLFGGPLRNILDKSEIFTETAFSEERKKSREMAKKETQSYLGRWAANLTTKEGWLQTLLPFSKDAEKRFEAKLLEKEGQRQEQLFEGFKKSDPKKLIAAQKGVQLTMGELPYQRMMGLSDKEYLGPKGFWERAIGEGFDPELAKAMAVQMQAAGASTKGMKNLTTLGLKAERGLDLTNAGTVLGRLSGVVGDTRSEQTLEKIIASGFKKGLKGSDYVEELRKFSDTASQIISATGATGSQQIENILSEFSGFVKEKSTPKELEAAKTAYELYQQSTAETGGRAGAIQFASLYKRGLGKLGPLGISALMGREVRTLDENSLLMKLEAAAMGEEVSPEDLAKLTRGGKQESFLLNYGISQKEMEDLRKKGWGKNSSLEQYRKLAKEDPKTFNRLRQAVERYAAMNPQLKTMQEIESGFFGAMGLGETADLTEEQKAAQQALATKPKETGKAADKVIEAYAEQARETLKIFSEFKDVITPTSEGVEKLGKSAEEAGKKIDTILQQGAPANQGKMKGQNNTGKPAPITPI